MKKAFLSFQEEIEKLLDFLASVESEHSLLKGILANIENVEEPLVADAQAIVGNSINRKRFVHCQAVIVLYGALERFVEEAIREYVVESKELCTSYDQLPKAIRDKHTRLSIEYLHRINRRSINKVEDGELQTTISRLNSTIKSQSKFLLNDRAFVLRNENARVRGIQTLLANIGISLALPTLLRMRSFQTGYDKLHRAESTQADNAAVDRVFPNVDNLVSMRNQIAHGVVDLSNLEDVNLLRDRALDLRNFVVVIADLIEMNFVQYCYEKHSMPLASPVAVYNNNVVCIEFPNGQMNRGDVVVLRVADGDFRFSSIQSIEVEKKSVNSITGQKGITLGFKVGFHAIHKDGYRLLDGKVNGLLRNSIFQLMRKS